MCWCVGYCVADYFADFDAAGLVEEEHDDDSSLQAVLRCELSWVCGDCHKAMVNV